jgi:ABC-type nitrate/sulfonate/bicarbonate transport system ATPase subunit
MKIVVRNLSIRRSPHFTLEVDELELGTDSVTAIVGPNGGGKSTLLHALSGLDQRMIPCLQFDGSPWGVDTRKYVTLMFQRPRLFHLTVMENTLLPLHFRGIPRSEAREMAIGTLTSLGIAHLADRRADRLSGGETQKAALARALVFNPRVLLLDEPTASMDNRSTELAERAVLEYAARTGANVVWVTHDGLQASRVANRTLRIEEGKVL